MSSQKIVDYLTKQLFIERNIVTYRLLSREFGFHVHIAKNELATYHDTAPYASQANTCSATYLVSGQAKSSKSTQVDEDVDMGFGELTPETVEDNNDEVPQFKITLVNEKDLDAAMLQYTQVSSIHVYSLSPSPIRDAGLLCASTDSVREIDGKKGPEFAVTLGRIVGTNIQMKAGPLIKAKAPVAGSSKARPVGPVAPALSRSDTKLHLEESKDKSKQPIEQPKDKPKVTSKIEFFKAKPKELPKPEVVRPKPDVRSKQFFKAEPSPPAAAKKEVIDEVKRGTKRKSAAHLLSDSENEGTSAPPSKPPSRENSTLRVKKGFVLSDEDDSDVSMKPRRKARMSIHSEAADSEAEREAHALMDIDDDQVERVSRVTDKLSKVMQNPEVEEEEKKDSRASDGEDVDMDNMAPIKVKAKAKSKKKAPKKVIPVGSNGLKKRRVVKSRTQLNEKGYMVTEDYSSYESVGEEDEEEVIPVTKAKLKVTTSKEAVGSRAASPSDQPMKTVIKSAPSVKRKPSGTAKLAKGPGNISSFFNPKTVKK